MTAFPEISRPGGKALPIALFALALVGFVPTAGLAQETTPPDIVAPSADDSATDATDGTAVADETGAQTREAGESPAAVTLVELADGLVTLAVSADTEIGDITGDARQTWAMLAHPDAPELRHTAFLVAQPEGDAAALAEALMAQFNAIDSVAEGMQGETPVWIIDGAARRRPDLGRIGAGEIPRARLLVTPSCLPEGGPLMLGLVTTATRGVPSIMQAILSPVQIALPEGAAPCPDTVAAAVMGLPLGAINHPEEPEPEPEPELTENVTANAASAAGTQPQPPTTVPTGKPGNAAPAPDPQDTQAWQAALTRGDAPAMWTYLKAFPDGAFAEPARQALQVLTARQPTPAQPPARSPAAGK